MHPRIPVTTSTEQPSMTPADPHVAIVDGYTTGAFLPHEFARLGMTALHIQSTWDLLPRLRQPVFDQYDKCLRHSGSPDSFAAMVDVLRGVNTKAVIAGQEPGVYLADELAAALSLPGNNPTTSHLRRDKYSMIEAVRSADLHCARQCLVETAAEASDAAQTQFTFPVVVKPLSSASTDSVAVCTTAQQVSNAATRILSSSDLFGQPGRHVLLQSFLEGPEYIVDTVTALGSTYVCGIWRYSKRLTSGGSPVYERDTLIDPSCNTARSLAEYIRTVLPALGVVQGAAHSEVIVTETGPALVELGARLNGNLQPTFHDTATGNNQAFLAALAYYDPRTFQNQFGGRSYSKRQDAVVLHAVNTRSGVVRSVNSSALTRLHDLSAVCDLNIKVPVGGRLIPTEDLVSSPLRVFLTASHADELEVAINVVREIEPQLYNLIDDG